MTIVVPQKEAEITYKGFLKVSKYVVVFASCSNGVDETGSNATGSKYNTKNINKI